MIVLASMSWMFDPLRTKVPQLHMGGLVQNSSCNHGEMFVRMQTLWSVLLLLLLLQQPAYHIHAIQIVYTQTGFTVQVPLFQIPSMTCLISTISFWPSGR